MALALAFLSFALSCATLFMTYLIARNVIRLSMRIDNLQQFNISPAEQGYDVKYRPPGARTSEVTIFVPGHSESEAVAGVLRQGVDPGRIVSVVKRT